MNFLTHFPKNSRGQRGFTLIELLVVIAIIAVLLSLGAMGLSGLNGGKGVANSVSTSEALFEEARMAALGRGCYTRVLVDATDPKKEANYLRRMFIIQEKSVDDGNGGQKFDRDASGEAQSWELKSRALYLNQGVYFSQQLSRDSEGGQTPKMSFTGDKQDYNGDYYYYEYNPEGLCTKAGARFVIGAGILPKGSQEPRTTGAAKRDFGGFVLWKNGRSSLIRDPQQIEGIQNITSTF